jgi:hypothetical protein
MYDNKDTERKINNREGVGMELINPAKESIGKGLREEPRKTLMDI